MVPSFFGWCTQVCKRRGFSESLNESRGIEGQELCPAGHWDAADSPCNSEEDVAKHFLVLVEKKLLFTDLLQHKFCVTTDRLTRALFTCNMSLVRELGQGSRHYSDVLQTYCNL